MQKKLQEWISVHVAKNPGRIVLAVILLFNVIFFIFSAVIISNLSLSGTENMNFFEAAFSTIAMILDAGCVQFVISDIGHAGVTTALLCLAIILIGMISFTGAVIGYITNYISHFIENSNTGVRKLHISDHVVILNWNSRASEIVNDMLYCGKPQKVVVLTDSRKDEIERELEERLADTVSRERRELQEECKNLPFLQRNIYLWRKKLRNRVTVIVRKGDVYSSKQLHDISLEKAKMIMILGNDIVNETCRYATNERLEDQGRGNSQTIKTLMQVADITSASDSRDNQKIIVEITDNWTLEVVEKIIKWKEVREKCNIIPVKVNQILGQILSQFSLMPELNLAYKELFSNKGAAFFSEPYEGRKEGEFVETYLKNHHRAIPLTHMDFDGQSYHYFSAASEKDVHTEGEPLESDYQVKLNKDYWIENKNVIILGHNSKCMDIMQGFSAFCGEWHYKNGIDKILRILVIDDKDSLEKFDHYVKYPFVVKTVPASIYEKDKISEAIEDFVAENEGDTSILILSNDMATNEETDASALANLVYVQDIINRKREEDPDFDPESIDVIVEIINPKHHDIVNSYSVNNVVISNRYISKMITQIGEKEALFDFFTDILTYDEDDTNGYVSKEIYVKKVDRLFTEVPAKCNAAEFIRAVYKASAEQPLPAEERNLTVALGYVKPGGKLVLFEGDQTAIPVELSKEDKLIVFSNH